jgi:(heptosyl)LPS beta-1,4-glucosyltransferase
MARLTVALIAKNEAEHIEACLQSVVWADEIVIIDSGSTDNTLEIAQRYTDKIFQETDWPGFGRQRQRAQNRSSGDWILALDADERVTPELKAEILAVLQQDDRQAVYAIPRLSWAFGAFIRHSGWCPDYVFRLYPAAKAGFDDAPVHEKLAIKPEMLRRYLKGHILHYTFRDLTQWTIKSAGYAGDWAKHKARGGKRTGFSACLIHPVAYFIKAYVLRCGFLDGKAGLLLAISGAYYRFLKYADLWLRNEASRQDCKKRPASPVSPG